MTEEELRIKYPGISDDLVRQILSLSAGDPSHYAKQYEQGSYLRRMATQGEAKTAAGAVAQTLAGATVARNDKRYADMIRGYQGHVVRAKRNWWNQKYPPAMTMPNPDELEELGGGYPSG